MGRGHYGRGHLGRGHYGRGHLGRGHYGRGYLGRGHYGRGYLGQGHYGRGHFGRIQLFLPMHPIQLLNSSDAERFVRPVAVGGLQKELPGAVGGRVVPHRGALVVLDGVVEGRSAHEGSRGVPVAPLPGDVIVEGVVDEGPLHG